MFISIKWLGLFMGKTIGRCEGVCNHSDSADGCTAELYSSPGVKKQGFCFSIRVLCTVAHGKQKRFYIHKVASSHNGELFTLINSQRRCFITAISKCALNTYGDYIC